MLQLKFSIIFHKITGVKLSSRKRIKTYEDLLQVIRAKIQSLEFIPDAELRVQ